METVQAPKTPFRALIPPGPVATIFIIDHVLKPIMKPCGRVIVINFGEKIAEGTPEEVTRNPGVIEA